ncbi:MAG TPA: rod shape-determining protein MreC [Paracoccaceae bacterium]|nr:rod shape-determining protein MreC [Paracoccaceae bacterium]
MAERPDPIAELTRDTRRLVVGVIVVLLLGLFFLWRIDNTRVEQLRMDLIDRFVPSFEWTVRPVAAVARMVGEFQSYTQVYQQNEELRRELQAMRGWREAALQLEQKNAQLLALNNVRLNPRLTFVTGEVMADAGGPFRRAALVNIGRADGIRDGAVAMDGLGIVGRIAGTGERASRILFLTDSSSRLPVTVKPSGQRAILAGDNGPLPVLDFLDGTDAVRPGDRVVSSGAGGLFPPDLLVGQVVAAPDGRLRVHPAADFRRLHFVRVIRPGPSETVSGPGDLIGALIPQPDAAAEPGQ